MRIIISAQRVGFFNIGSGLVGYWTKYRVAGRVRVPAGHWSEAVRTRKCSAGMCTNHQETFHPKVLWKGIGQVLLYTISDGAVEPSFTSTNPFLRKEGLLCIKSYLIIVADATDAVSVTFSGRCKFLQI